MGVAAGDYDNDGFADLYVTSYGGNTLYRNNGDGTFADVTRRAGVAAGGWSASAGFFDYDNDGKLDLFVTRYVEWSVQEQPLLRGEEARLPRLLSSRQLRRDRQHPVSQQRRRHVHRRVVEGRHRRCQRQGARRRVRRLRPRRLRRRLRRQRLGAVVSVPQQRERHVHRGRPARRASGSTRTARPSPAWAWTSPTTTTTATPTSSSPTSRTNATGCSARTATAASATRPNLSGVGGATLPFSGWSTRFFDYDNDGWKDMFVAQGHVMDTIEKTSPNLRYLQPPLLLRNESGRFVRVVPGDVFQKDWAGRGAAFGDLDNDGDIDVVVSNVGQKALRAPQRRRQPQELARRSERSARRRTATGSAAGSRSCPPPG